MTTLTQCKDIRNRDFLRAVELSRGVWCSSWAMVPDVAQQLAAMGYEATPTRSGQPQPAVPAKLVRAKAEKLIRQGLMDGCTCGCRGDFELTSRGREHLAAPSVPGDANG